jgi:hypothetical protein
MKLPFKSLTDQNLLIWCHVFRSPQPYMWYLFNYADIRLQHSDNQNILHEGGFCFTLTKYLHSLAGLYVKLLLNFDAVVRWNHYTSRVGLPYTPVAQTYGQYKTSSIDVVQ